MPLPSVFRILDGVIPLTSSKRLDKELQKIAATAVGQVMSPNPIMINPETALEVMATLMVTKNIHPFQVTEEGRLVGGCRERGHPLHPYGRLLGLQGIDVREKAKYP